MRRTARRALAGMAGLALVAWTALAVAADVEDILVVYHPGLPPEAHTPEGARDAFLGEDRVWGGRKLKPAVYMDSDPTQAQFVTTVLGMSVEAYDTHWTRKILHEGRPAPKRLQSPRAMLEYVATTPGAVGYVRQADAAAVAAYGDRLKVLPWAPMHTSGR